jgi:hypothetical protein
MRQANRIFESQSNVELTKASIVTLDVQDFLQSRVFRFDQ